MPRSRVLPRSFYKRDSRLVAPELLNKVLVAGERSGRIVEVEAYAGAEDPGSHTYRGLTKRNAVMFGPPGHMYVYFTYGMHWCANAVCGDEGVGVAVLIRALEPLRGVEEMFESRQAARNETELCNGPAKLCQALGITGVHNGVDLVKRERGIAILDDGVLPPKRPKRSTRVGLSQGDDLPWRWWVPNSAHVSR